MTDQTSAEIVRRLREFRCWSVRRGHYEPLPLCEEAASLIESLSAGKAGSGVQYLAEIIHKARWPEDRAVEITPFADEDAHAREYCFRIARAVLPFTNDMTVRLAIDCDKLQSRALAAESTVARLTGEKEIETQKRGFAEFEWKRSDERAAAAEARLAEAAQNFRAIKQATVDGRVCDDVAWFDAITTLHDFCELAAINCAVGRSQVGSE
jgi:hypothetical protein